MTWTRAELWVRTEPWWTQPGPAPTPTWRTLHIAAEQRRQEELAA